MVVDWAVAVLILIAAGIGFVTGSALALYALTAFGSDDIKVSAEDRVGYYCDVYSEDLPSWFDDHDRQLLIEFVGDD